MPEPHVILTHLASATNRGIVVAILWHAVVAVAAGALVYGWRPSRRQARALVSVPLASASVVALVLGNPFNGALLGLGAIGLALLGLGADRDHVAPAPVAVRVAGILMIAFGFFYPHFLETRAVIAYSFAAPLGVIPCPTLSAMIGFALLGNGLGSRTWSLTLAALGTFYGVFGVLRLGVHLDVLLIAGAVVLTFIALRKCLPTESTSSAIA